MFYQTYLEASFFWGGGVVNKISISFPFIYFLFISYSCPIHFLFISQIQFSFIPMHFLFTSYSFPIHFLFIFTPFFSFSKFFKKQINNMAVSKDLGLADVLIYAKSN